MTNTNPVTGIENIYLEQKSINRFRLYSFSQENSAVNLSIRAFDTNYSVTGLCNRPDSEHTLDSSKVLATSCNLELLWEPIDYIGNNSPNALLLLRKNKIFVGWVERSETQQNQRLLVLGFVPQPNLRLSSSECRFS
ncbi:MAG: hypothetical protein HWQ35_24605 [Nostoc sp. NMS1]|uniref:CpcT/CpeT family chromophore lyase n=1 Tax=unclassified Nostoc TaxID=2593658 RepID=UPI0025EDB3EC|nr:MULTISPECIES: CpcT/CpeT family chromophore lyase [unclassified Nostoc]MBN3909598.1 hypothetical protein [Nostoc sp. NMS1]